MRNFVHHGDVVPVFAPYDLATGDGCLVGLLFGVAVGPKTAGQPIELMTEGVFDLTAVSADVGTEGFNAYWDNTARKVTASAAGFFIGKFTQTKGAGQTTARVTLVPNAATGVSGAALPFTSRVLTYLDDDKTLVAATAQVATVNLDLPASFGCTFSGPVSFAGTANVSNDKRTAGDADPTCSLVQTSPGFYKILGTKV